jgi:hypothetical protein
MMRRRRVIVRRRTSGSVDEWERGWELVIRRIENVPTVVKKEPLFHDCLTVLNGAFADGNYVQFTLGMNALIDICAEAGCEQ